MMLNANDPEFSARYPHGAIVRDRWGRQQAAEINRIAAAMAERNAAVRHELASLGGSARDATWAVRRLLGER